MSGRWQVVAAFLAGAAVVGVCLLAYEPAAPELSLAAKKALLKKVAATQQKQMLSSTTNYHTINWVATDITDRPMASGNTGHIWNAINDNFEEPNSVAISHGWNSGADTVHGFEDGVHLAGGVGMFGKYGVDDVRDRKVTPEEYDPSVHLPAEGEECPLYPGIKRWILNNGDKETCTETCSKMGMGCMNYDAPASLKYMDCIFEAAGEHCSTEYTPEGANDKFKEVTDRPDVLNKGFAPGFCRNHDQCYYFQTGGVSGCDTPGGWNAFQRLCGCTEESGVSDAKGLGDMATV